MIKYDEYVKLLEMKYYLTSSGEQRTVIIVQDSKYFSMLSYSDQKSLCYLLTVKQVHKNVFLIYFPTNF